MPRRDMPAATPTMFCSAMNISKNRSGCVFSSFSENVEILVSPSSATIRSFFSTSFTSASPYASRVATDSPIFRLILMSLLTGRSSRWGRGRGLGRKPSEAYGCDSSARAVSSSCLGTGFPCQPSMFSSNEMPLPLNVRATITRGLGPASRLHFANASMISE